MKSVFSALAASSALVGAASAATVQGFDISSYQGSVDFASAYSSGARFVIIKVSALLNNFMLVVFLTTGIGH
jgi:GH25 family lysozyme M1 (1,4-beta-N-acetylmuramidase)